MARVPKTHVEVLYMAAFAYNIKQRMRASNITMRRLAFMIGDSMKAVRRAFEHNSFSLHMAFAIAAALKCDIDDLVPPPPVSTPIAPRRNMYVGKNGYVTKSGRCLRSYYYYLQRERGYALPRGAEHLHKGRARVAEESVQRAKKIRTRSELAREKARAARERAQACKSDDK